MAVQVQIRRGNTTAHGTFAGAAGEITYNNSKDTLVVHTGDGRGTGKEMLRADFNNIDTINHSVIPTLHETGTTALGETPIVNEDWLFAVDITDDKLKKITKGDLLTGLAASGAITSVAVSDTTRLTVGTNNGTATLDLATTITSQAAKEYGSATQAAVFTVDQYGRITAISEVAITQPSVPSVESWALTTTADTSKDATVNNITATGNATIGNAAGDTHTVRGATTFHNNVTLATNVNLSVGGDLTVSGTTTTVNSETINLADSILLLNSNKTTAPTSSIENAGIEIERGTAVNVHLIWDETANRWHATRVSTDDDLVSNNTPIITEEIVTIGATALDGFLKLSGGDYSSAALAVNDIPTLTTSKLSDMPANSTTQADQGKILARNSAGNGYVLIEPTNVGFSPDDTPATTIDNSDKIPFFDVGDGNAKKNITRENLLFTGTASGLFNLPSGTTAQRPPSSGLSAGMIRYNTDRNRFEGYKGAGVAGADSDGYVIMEFITDFGALDGTNEQGGSGSNNVFAPSNDQLQNVESGDLIPVFDASDSHSRKVVDKNGLQAAVLDNSKPMLLSSRDISLTHLSGGVPVLAADVQIEAGKIYGIEIANEYQNLTESPDNVSSMQWFRGDEIRSWTDVSNPSNLRPGGFYSFGFTATTVGAISHGIITDSSIKFATYYLGRNAQNRLMIWGDSEGRVSEDALPFRLYEMPFAATALGSTQQKTAGVAVTTRNPALINDAVIDANKTYGLVASNSLNFGVDEHGTNISETRVSSMMIYSGAEIRSWTRADAGAAHPLSGSGRYGVYANHGVNFSGGADEYVYFARDGSHKITAWHGRTPGHLTFYLYEIPFDAAAVGSAQQRSSGASPDLSTHSMARRANDAVIDTNKVYGLVVASESGDNSANPHLVSSMNIYTGAEILSWTAVSENAAVALSGTGQYGNVFHSAHIAGTAGVASDVSYLISRDRNNRLMIWREEAPGFAGSPRPVYLYELRNAGAATAITANSQATGDIQMNYRNLPLQASSVMADDTKTYGVVAATQDGFGSRPRSTGSMNIYTGSEIRSWNQVTEGSSVVLSGTGRYGSLPHHTITGGDYSYALGRDAANKLMTWKNSSYFTSMRPFRFYEMPFAAIEQGKALNPNLGTHSTARRVNDTVIDAAKVYGLVIASEQGNVGTSPHSVSSMQIYTGAEIRSWGQVTDGAAVSLSGTGRYGTMRHFEIRNNAISPTYYTLGRDSGNRLMIWREGASAGSGESPLPARLYELPLGVAEQGAPLKAILAAHSTPQKVNDTVIDTAKVYGLVVETEYSQVADADSSSYPKSVGSMQIYSGDEIHQWSVVSEGNAVTLSRTDHYGSLYHFETYDGNFSDTWYALGRDSENKLMIWRESSLDSHGESPRPIRLYEINVVTPNSARDRVQEKTTHALAAANTDADSLMLNKFTAVTTGTAGRTLTFPDSLGRNGDKAIIGNAGNAAFNVNANRPDDNAENVSLATDAVVTVQKMGDQWYFV